MKIKRLERNQLSFYWKKILPHLETVWNQTPIKELINIADLLDSLVEGTMTVWIAEEGDQILGAGITRISNYPKARTCTLFCCGAVDNKINWLEEIEQLENWAKEEEKCDIFLIDGRIGWKRVMEKAGYNLDSVILSKRL